MKILMTPPRYFRVDDLGINPYMTGEIPIDPERAKRQWFALVNLLVNAGVTVYFAKPQINLPDMVFSANAGSFIGNIFLPSQFLYRSRQGETEFYTETLEKLGYGIYPTYPEIAPFEGQGDTQSVADRTWIGYGFRTSREAARRIVTLFKKRGERIHYLDLVDPYFYHLDTCLRVVRDKKGDWILYYPQAFSPKSRKRLESVYPSGQRIAVTRREALEFSCNCIDLPNRCLVGHKFSCRLKKAISQRGYHCRETDMSEFLRSGGSVHCCLLELPGR